MEVAEPTAGGPVANRRPYAVGQRVKQGVDLSILEAGREANRTESPLVLAGLQEATVQEALARQDAVIGHEEIAHEAERESALPSQVRGQRLKERLLGPVRLWMRRQIETRRAQHAVQIREYELRIGPRRINHRPD